MLELATKHDRSDVNRLARQVHEMHVQWRPDLYNMPEEKLADESKREYRERTKDVKYPVVEKLFEIGRKMKDRKGGYTRIYKLGPRRGDAAEMVILEIL